MDEKDIPDIDSESAGEGCTVILIFIALFAGFQAFGLSWLDPASGFAALSIAAGLAAIAVALLTVGRRIDQKE